MIIVPHCGCCSKNVLYRYCAISPNIFSLQLGQFLQQIKSSRVNMFDSVSCHPPPSGIWRGNICTLSVSFSGKKSTAGYFLPLSCPCNSYLMKYEWSLWLKLLVCQVCDLNSQKLVSWYFCWTWSLYQVLDLKSLKYLDWTNVVPVECQVSVCVTSSRAAHWLSSAGHLETAGAPWQSAICTPDLRGPSEQDSGAGLDWRWA